MRFLVGILLALSATSAAPTEDILKSFTLSNNQFTADVYKEYKADADKNFVACPLSAEILLALIHAGAGGNTATQLSNALRLPQKRNNIDEIYNELNPKLQAGGKYTLESANKIYVKKDFTVDDGYKATAINTFGASIENIDFGQKKSVVTAINGWVNEKTHKKIPQLVTEEDITEETRAVLLNAIYFKGKWVQAFKKTETKERPFYLTEKSYVDVDTMQLTGEFRYFKSVDLKARFLELPYEGDDITMTIVLPDSKEGLPALEDRIHEVVVEPAYFFRTVNLRLPKNKISTFIRFDPILKQLGIKDAFEPTANFTEMLTNKDDPLYINKIIQKALIETDEEGTVAAAVTGGFMFTTLSLNSPPPIPVKFYANHPFIFYLKHKEAGILFIGRYSAPDGNVVVLDQPPKEED